MAHFFVSTWTKLKLLGKHLLLSSLSPYIKKSEIIEKHSFKQEFWKSNPVNINEYLYA
jgi:hypothetical protein